MFEQVATEGTFERKAISHIKHHWQSRVRNVKDLEVFQGKEIESQVKKNPSYIKVILYVKELFEASGYVEASFLKHKTLKPAHELREWEHKGEICLYLSVVAYVLFEKLGVFSDKEMKLVQGYFLHEVQKENVLAYAMGRIHVSVHAWLSIKGSVIDLSIGQERDFFDFEEEDIITGIVPEKLTLKGFGEPKKVVQKHLKRYVNFANMQEEEWVEMHLSEANHMLEEIMKKL